MEFRDRMRKLRRRNFFYAIVLMATGILLAFITSQNPLVKQLAVINYGMSVCIVGILVVAASFEYKRPDFIITEKLIVLSNQPMVFLIGKKDFRFEVEYSQIEEAAVLSTDIFLRIRNQRRKIGIPDWALDDFQTARALILKELVNRNIPGIMPRR